MIKLQKPSLTKLEKLVLDKLTNSKRGLTLQTLSDKLKTNINNIQEVINSLLDDGYDIILKDGNRFYLYHAREEIHGEEEKAPKVQDCGDYYIVNSKIRSLEVKKDTVRELKKIYCTTKGPTINRAADVLGMTRQDFMLIKNAFHITKDDIPYIDEDVMSSDTETLVDDTLENRKHNFFIRLEGKKFQDMEKRIKEYDTRNYFLNLALDTLKPEIQKIQLVNSTYKYKPSKYKNTLMINISDTHQEKLVNGKEVLGEPKGFNHAILKKRLDKYLNRCIETIEKDKPERVIITATGDGVDNPNADQYPKQYLYQQEKGAMQFTNWMKNLLYFVKAIYNINPNISFIGIPGNHSKGLVNWDILAYQLMEMFLEDYKSIQMDSANALYKLAKVYNSNFIFTHGQYIKKGKSTRENSVLNIIQHFGLQQYNTYVVQGHLHHEEVEGARYKFIMLPSIVGGDDLSGNMMITGSRPAQQYFVVTKDGLTEQKHVYFD